MASPVLAIRDAVLFPGAYLRVSVGRESSLRLVQETLWKSFHASLEAAAIAPVHLGVFTEHDDALGVTGTLARVVQLQRARTFRKNVHEYEYSMLLHGLARVSITETHQTTPFILASLDKVDDTYDTNGDARPLRDLVKHVTAAFAVSKRMQLPRLSDDDDDRALAKISAWIDMLSAHLQGSLQQSKRFSTQPIRALTLSRKQPTTPASLSKSYKENSFNDDDGDEMEGLAKKLAALDASLAPATAKVLSRELARLKRMSPQQPEYHVIQNYLEFMLDLPWTSPPPPALDMATVQATLDADHYGMTKAKTRLVEFMAVRQLQDAGKGLILCLVGPPGVGKTSLAQSMATATGRPLARLALGGVADETEVRGHRKTYVGAMPGSVLSALRRAQSAHALVVLDEIDKLSSRNASASSVSHALLEVLDPHQNHAFTDHYANVPFDLSRVLFVATANSVETIPRPLLDRMEVLHLDGYTLEEKMAIANTYIWPRQLAQHGLADKSVVLDDDVLPFVIQSHTREAGVRDLERKMGAICRHVAVRVVQQQPLPSSLSVDFVSTILGPDTVHDEVALRTGVHGVATGLAWTPSGGAILFVEATALPRSSSASSSSSTIGLQLTGALGDVMKESAQLALTWLRVYLEESSTLLSHIGEFHIHFPHGATPKDGPSAGIAIVSALVSVVTKRLVPVDMAMTGEITLRGVVLPVGGVPQKLQAAKRAGIARVLLPAANRADGDEWGPKLGLAITYVSDLNDVLATVFGLPRGTAWTSRL
ncbi:ATP-dependent protease La [Saprolegnia parasitica CBS 223.65]|uniref:Lon protease homolog n=1 Tax=Saprolegnia parasitica (strain CBS 223.65) TaxID=695850 RepID=A0A067CUR0_SAPPC|nr:ATP-dependent protease La [Saprolegnia parasitica CBS 223.65]KDO34218.1 ATP-dependent protease La [Saprolegnia parasitica CBS 223.65]|eukprot:XP_012195036.1 ATP-dependent protease La [Saprolegnia parasitica CBS 223.65]